MYETAINRLKEERKEWRKNHPFVSTHMLAKTTFADNKK